MIEWVSIEQAGDSIVIEEVHKSSADQRALSGITLRVSAARLNSAGAEHLKSKGKRTMQFLTALVPCSFALGSMRAA
jgi:hypothetical protein